MPVLNPGTHSIRPKVVENKKKWKKNGKGRFEDNKKLLKKDKKCLGVEDGGSNEQFDQPVSIKC
jgi:hypothetical protein